MKCPARHLCGLVQGTALWKRCVERRAVGAAIVIENDSPSLSLSRIPARRPSEQRTAHGFVPLPVVHGLLETWVTLGPGPSREDLVVWLRSGGRVTVMQGEAPARFAISVQPADGARARTEDFLYTDGEWRIRELPPGPVTVEAAGCGGHYEPPGDDSRGRVCTRPRESSKARLRACGHLHIPYGRRQMFSTQSKWGVEFLLA